MTIEEILEGEPVQDFYKPTANMLREYIRSDYISQELRDLTDEGLAKEKSLMNLWQCQSSLLHGEPAEAAARVLAYYYSGFDKKGLEPDKLRQDVKEIAQLLNEWIELIISSAE